LFEDITTIVGVAPKLTYDIIRVNRVTAVSGNEYSYNIEYNIIILGEVNAN
jgi:hypothetical protein